MTIRHAVAVFGVRPGAGVRVFKLASSTELVCGGEHLVSAADRRITGRWS